MRTFFKAVWEDNQGQDLVEYALLAGFVAVAVTAMFPTSIYQPIESIYQALDSRMTNITGL